MVMLVVVLVSILTGAFLTINRTNLFLLGSAKDKACLLYTSPSPRD